MSRYRVTSVDVTHTRHQAVVEALSADEVAAAEAAAGRLVIDLRPDASWRGVWAYLNRDLALSNPVKERDLAQWARSLSGFLGAGIAIDEALQLTLETTRRARPKAVLAALLDSVRSGSTLRASLEREGGFPPTFVALVGAGELSGTLPAAMASIAAQLEGHRAFVEKMRSALIYPAFLTITASAAILVLLTVVVPNLQSLVESQDATTLPVMTQAVLAASDVVRTFGPWFAGALVAVIVLAGLVVRTASGQSAFHRAQLAVPLAGRLIVASDWSRYCRTMSALLAGGVQLSTAMPLALVSISNLTLRREFAAAHERVVSGSLLATALDPSRHRPNEALALIRMGERTGRLHQALAHAGTLLEQGVQQTLERTTTLIGPVLTLVFGMIAGTIVYAMLSTILSINEFAFR
ncbi:type II secretory pathway component PulF [Kaistia hirudinis]|uniref:General secretion pathway protein F n=1 Tax=Kaistia hirudinis TaxID=1293440 RepID=A0A840ALA0_9HYPH|nr:type II secretion system F family protein [Kaistia hirudinis]MBB3930033.1 type II secretory pathway component PulF [Kaistia hirudinis]